MSIQSELFDLAERFLSDHLNHGSNDFELGDPDAAAEEIAEDMGDEMECDLESMMNDWMEQHGEGYCDSAERALKRTHDAAIIELKSDFMDQMQTINDDGSTGWDICYAMLQLVEVGDHLTRDMAQEFSGMAYKAAKNWFSGTEWDVLNRDGLLDEWYAEWADNESWECVEAVMEDDDAVNPVTDM